VVLAGLQEMPHVGTVRWAGVPPGNTQASHKEQKRLGDEMVQRGLGQARWLFSVELGLMEAAEQTWLILLLC